MHYMVLERFKNAPEIYRRLQARGRMMPAGLEYVSSWISLDCTRCWQLMRTDDPQLFEQWMSAWSDLMEFEIVPVQTSAEAAQSIASRLP